MPWSVANAGASVPYQTRSQFTGLDTFAGQDGEYNPSLVLPPAPATGTRTNGILMLSVSVRRWRRWLRWDLPMA